MKSPCRDPQCPEFAVRRGYCPIHSKEREAVIHSKERKAVYNSRRWRYLRRRRLNIDPLCECGEIATDVDHIEAMADGGDPFSLENTRSLCHSCHSRITRQAQLIQAK